MMIITFLFINCSYSFNKSICELLYIFLLEEKTLVILTYFDKYEKVCMHYYLPDISDILREILKKCFLFWSNSNY